MYSTCDGSIPGLNKFAAAFGALRGKMAKIVIGGMVLISVMSNASVTLVNDTDTMANFSFTFSVIAY
jgi:hypothetical protein